ncbi:MAG: OmpA family protein [Bacteroidia bacterium]
MSAISSPRLPVILVLACIFFAPVFGWAQTPSKAERKANAFYQAVDYERAIPLYKDVLASEPSNYTAAFRLGQMNFVKEDYRQSLQYYRKASEIAPSRNDTVYFQIGIVYKILGNCRKAKESFNEFIRRHKTRDDFLSRAELEQKGCDLIESTSQDRPAYRVGEASFNSPNIDIMPSLLSRGGPDQYIVFTSHRPARKRNKPYGKLGQPAHSDLYTVVMEDDSTFGQEVTNIGKPVNTKFNDGASTLTGDGRTMYYTIFNEKRGNNSIYQTAYDLRREGWSKPNKVERVNGYADVVVNSKGKTKKRPTYDAHPYVSKDGRTIFFSSDRPGGQGGMDIWFARRVGSGWSEPINAGPIVNTPFDEVTPFLSDNGGTLFFSSNGHVSFGGQDLFKAEGQIGNWTDPVNLGKPLNSTYDEYSPMAISEDSTVLFASNRPGGTGDIDIYWAREIFYPVEIPAISLHGIIRDANTKQPIPFAIAILYEATAGGLVVLDTFETDQSARYNFELEADRTYRILGNALEYFANEITVATPSESADLERNIDIELDPIILRLPIVLQNIYYDFDKSYLRPDAIVQLDTLVDVLLKNPEISVQMGSHTDSYGSNSYNDRLSDRRALSAAKYLVFKGINPTRITYYGYGKRQPLISPEVSPEDGQVNRRTEFRVTKIRYGDE